MRGGQYQVLYLLRGLRDRGHAVRLLARRGGPLLDQAIADAIDTPRAVGLRAAAQSRLGRRRPRP